MPSLTRFQRFYRYVCLVLLNWYIRFAGVRMYQSTDPPKSDVKRTCTIYTVQDYTITFSFYRDTVEYLKYINSALIAKQSPIFIIEANYPPEAPESLRKYATIRLFVRHSEFLFASISTDLVADALLHTYLEFIENVLRKNIKARLQPA